MKKLLCRVVTVILFLLLAFQSSALIYQNTAKAAGSPDFYFGVDKAYKDSLAAGSGYKIIAVDDLSQEDASSTPEQTNDTSTPSEETPEQSDAEQTDAPTENPSGLHATDLVPIIAVAVIIALVTLPLILLRKRTYVVSFCQVGVGHEYTGPVVIVDGVNYDKFGTSFWWKAKSIHNFMYLTRLDGSTGKQYVLSSVSGAPNERNYITVIGNNAIVGNYKVQFKIKVFEERPNPKRKPFYTP
jgi:hypothetical protein